MPFVNRTRELAALEAWWAGEGARLGLVWGRRRVGKTLLLQHFAESHDRVVWHTFAGRSARDELEVLADSWRTSSGADWELSTQSWTHFLATLSARAREDPVLLILDEFPDGVRAIPELPGIIRALWDDHRARGQMRILLCGSAVRTMNAMQEERAALYGRFDLSLLVHPFDPHEAALMLPAVHPLHRMVAWGVLGGTPHHLELWDQTVDPPANIRRLFFSRGARMLVEGELALRGETLAELEVQVLHAIALGRTRHNQIADVVHAEPSRQIERLIELRLVERLQPVTEEGTRSRRRIYRLADNFMAFWLGHVLPHRAAIDAGLGDSACDLVMARLAGFLGPRFEEAFRLHLRRMAAQGALGEGVLAVGAFWAHENPPAPGGERNDTEIDAVVLAGARRDAVLAGEAKLHHSISAPPLLRALERKTELLPRRASTMRLALAAGDAVVDAPPAGVLTYTARDIFGVDGEHAESLRGEWVPA